MSVYMIWICSWLENCCWILCHKKMLSIKGRTGKIWWVKMFCKLIIVKDGTTCFIRTKLLFQLVICVICILSQLHLNFLGYLKLHNCWTISVNHINSRANLVGQVERITPRNSIYCRNITIKIQWCGALVDRMSSFE